MKYKKRFLIICLIICLFSIASVVASDVNETSLASENQIIIEGKNDKVISIENQDLSDIDLSEQNKLNDSHGTFTELAKDIGNATGELNLNRDYVYSSNDSQYKTGIKLTKKVVINGNGHTINGNNLSRAFYISASNIVLKNFSFINCRSTSNGGAIFTFNYGVVLNNCTFVNCSSKAAGGAIICAAEETVINCTFINCSSESSGGAISWEGIEGILSKCNFINCFSLSSGGAISGSLNDGVLNNCNFMNCHASENGGAVYLYRFNNRPVNLTNCNFINCHADVGGAIYNKHDYCYASSCDFIGCYAESYGGAIYNIIPDFKIVSSIFTDCHAKECGGSIYNTGDNSNIVSCSFTNCKSNKSGAIFNSGGNFNISSSFFKYCSAIKSVGGAIYNYGLNLRINSCGFTECNAKSEGGAIYNYYVSFNMSSCDFINCKANDCGGAIYNCYEDSTYYGYAYFIHSCIFKNCFANFGGAIYNSGHDFQIRSCDFTEGNAKYDGGAIYNNGNNNNIISCNFINCYTDNAKTTTKAAIYNRGANFIVNKCTYKDIVPQIVASNLNVIYSSDSYYLVKVYGNDGRLAKDTNVVIKINNKLFKTLKTDANGIVKFKVTQGPGNYKVKFTALGKTVTKTLTVKHILNLKTVKVKKSTKKIVLQATLSKINGKYIKNKKITFKFNGKKYTAKTNKKGIAKVTISKKVLKKLKVGKKIKYHATYLKDTVKKTVKIKK